MHVASDTHTLVPNRSKLLVSVEDFIRKKGHRYKWFDDVPLLVELEQLGNLEWRYILPRFLEKDQLSVDFSIPFGTFKKFLRFQSILKV